MSNDLSTLGEDLPLAVALQESFEQLRLYTEADSDFHCLLDLDSSQLRPVDDRPMTAVVQCCDALHFADFYQRLAYVIPRFLPHTMGAHGGGFMAAPDERLKHEKVLPFRHELAQKVATAVHVKQDQIARVICASHWPCGMALALGLNETDVIDLTLQGRLHIEASYQAYYEQQRLLDPEGFAADRYAWAMDVQVVPLLHIGYAPDAQRTWFIREQSFWGRLKEGRVKITEQPVINFTLLDAIHATVAHADELALERIRLRRGL